MKLISTVLAFTWFCVACGSMGRASEDHLFKSAIPLCAIVGEPKKFAGRVIQFRAVYKLTGHGVVLVGDDTCPGAFVVWRKTPDYSESKDGTIILNQVSQSDGELVADVVFRGTLQIVDRGFECSATTYCSNLVVETSTLLAARLHK